MGRDEFNHVRITNERGNISRFEFGKKPGLEFSSYKDNKIDIKAEVNENFSHNDVNKDKTKSKKEQDRLREELAKSNGSSSSASESTSSSSSSSSSSSAGSASSSSASSASSASASAASASAAGASSVAATVAAVSVTTVTTISTLVGINVFVQAKVRMNNLDITPISLNYDLDLSNTNEDKFIITIENKEHNYYSYQELKEGNNEGTFEELLPESKYALSVLDVTQDNFSIYNEEVVTAKKEAEPEPEPEPDPDPEPDPEPAKQTFEVTLYNDDEFTIQTITEGECVIRPEVDPESNW